MKLLLSFVLMLWSLNVLSEEIKGENVPCNAIPNKVEFKDAIKQKENVNLRFVTSFIEGKEKEKIELERIIQTDKSQSNATDFETFKNELAILSKVYKDTVFPVDLKKGKIVLIPNGTYYKFHDDNIKYSFEQLRLIIYRNKISQKKIGAKNDETIESYQKKVIFNSFTTDSVKSQNYTLVEKKSLDEYIQKLYMVEHTDFNMCLNIKQQNLNNINQDLQLANQKLNELTNKELYELDFKKNIMLIVGVLLGLILFFFFFGTLYKAGDHVKEKLIGETGLQFITIFVIIIAVILFGVMNILKGSELAAILSAIAGYILGKTTNQKSDKQLEVELELYKLKEEMRQKEASKQEKETK